MQAGLSHEQIKTGPLSWLWSLLLGPIYFAMKGKWRHALVSLLLTIVAGALSSWLYGMLAAWLLYPLLVEGINASTQSREASAAAEGAGIAASAGLDDPDEDIDAMIARHKSRLEAERRERREIVAKAATGLRAQATGQAPSFGKRRASPPGLT